MKLHNTFRLFLLAIFVIAFRANTASGQPVTVVSYYFGNYHPGDPRNVKSKGADWSEWVLVKNAKPRFAGHQQPHVPLWGYMDESKPEVMAQKLPPRRTTASAPLSLIGIIMRTGHFWTRRLIGDFYRRRTMGA
jgi:hypothetical protein